MSIVEHEGFGLLALQLDVYDDLGIPVASRRSSADLKRLIDAQLQIGGDGCLTGLCKAIVQPPLRRTTSDAHGFRTMRSLSVTCTGSGRLVGHDWNDRVDARGAQHPARFLGWTIDDEAPALLAMAAQL